MSAELSWDQEITGGLFRMKEIDRLFVNAWDIYKRGTGSSESASERFVDAASPEMRSVIDLAFEFARETTDRTLRAEHILLSIYELQPDVARSILNRENNAESPEIVFARIRSSVGDP